MSSPAAIYRFGPYELRTRTRERYKNGGRLKLRPQPFQILQALMERSGDAVTREELLQRTMAPETFFISVANISGTSEPSLDFRKP